MNNYDKQKYKWVESEQKYHFGLFILENESEKKRLAEIEMILYLATLRSKK